ncbi:MAG: hypothetical protein AAFQ94_04435 [Bacteroidota bacterium]
MIQLQLNKRAILFLILALVTFCSGLLMLQSGLFNQNSLMISAITIDLTITTSFFVFLFLKKQKVNPLAIGFIFILLIFTARAVIPNDQQFTLQLIIEYVAPLVELTLISIIIFKIVKARKHFLSLESGDFQRKLEVALFEIFKSRLAAKLASSELSMFYYAVFKWKKNKGYSYHKNSGIITIIATLLIVAIAEISIVHIILIKYAPIAAWVLFWISLYSIIQIIALGKAIYLRRVYRDRSQLFLHYGWLMSADISLSNIESVQSIDIKNIDPSLDFTFMGLFKDMEEKGLLLQISEPVKVSKLFKKTESKAIFIPVDSPDQLIEEISDYLKR